MKKIILKQETQCLSGGSLKVEINLFSKNEVDYLSIWRITPITDTKLERMFSSMWKVKTDWRNRLANEQLDHNLRISEGVPITKWYNKKVEINFKVVKLRKYPEKQHNLAIRQQTLLPMCFLISRNLMIMRVMTLKKQKPEL